MIAEEVKKHKFFSVQLEDSLQKNIFDMNKSDFQALLELYHESQNEDLIKTAKVIQDKYNTLQNGFAIGFENLKNNLNYEIQKVLDSYPEIPLPKRMDTIQLKIDALASKKEAFER